jgi:hypothetical protein
LRKAYSEVFFPFGLRRRRRRRRRRGRRRGGRK